MCGVHTSDTCPGERWGLRWKEPSGGTTSGKVMCLCHMLGSDRLEEPRLSKGSELNLRFPQGWMQSSYLLVVSRSTSELLLPPHSF